MMENEKQTHKAEEAAKKNPKPLKRNPAIVNFSREHHYGLLLCWKIRQGLKNGVEPQRMAAYADFFFENDLKQHFMQEEKHLFTALLPDHPFRIKAESDHRIIREKMQIAAKGKVDAVFLSDLADTLEGHIRFEERIMFNFIQQQLSDVQLAKIAEIHKEKPTDLDTGWQDHFWEIKK
ncbi:MAG TPA: hemerythrin domain-containing protein [Saprospiraceae bacterium]|nr:hemerythrin domain-containing protein [Saprospiraceae bacterium]HMZ73848.1 hemerythrin domain-containing protein [Saprospiraceae bacterium]HND16053.1 hemerythrin domain-containing protein [Saprospiraceae bacterium]HNE64759.1 hemerythrin domain-containing protein [Saprospiraceae bacterium]HNJ16515.1 hemerythrin domain-containing protein [Saprospiraceae bacterium]